MKTIKRRKTGMKENRAEFVKKLITGGKNGGGNTEKEKESSK
jgi:hypothetical protein